MHKKTQITIKDIAKELGISPSTVSKALKDHSDISDETKKAVRELVEKLNYRPDPIALSLKIGQSKTIGVIIPEIVHYFFSTVISGIEDEAYNSGYQVIFCQSNESYDREVRAVETLLSGRVDGILVSMSKTTDKYDHFKKIKEYGIPLVFFDRICEELETDKVIVDDEEGAFCAVSHLINEGCREIVHLAGPQNLKIAQERMKGYIRAILKAGLTIKEENIIKCDTVNDARLIVPGLIKRENRPDGIFAVNDLTAAEAMKVIKASGLNIPEDISVVGFTSGMISDLTDPPLTSVEQHGYEIGREAAKLLIGRIENKISGEFITRIIKTELIIKKSSWKFQTSLPRQGSNLRPTD
ncbi:MAG TPA: LacI family DNA-binding transcriptional regulator [Bacteroidales bacterium]|nr:LacI family DNA-binding transcriptional regulator [Bacteroidales bacterium]HOK73799.1 LacI family DNA-binding transcriptional regulator [Bacteroidales bacterium]HOM40055.1 LacI family DNA-binding transcriptional regulator [Bacteroidales bacterium]HPP91760.1 LacI family DNA-binding transcriptional regulator [Bacteroidales bacterium]HRR15365.1 LacI family DNA-binding transcriptional regulator [Bacteroidales bacterium]